MSVSLRAQPSTDQSAAANVAAPDRSSHVTIDGVTIDDAAVTTLFSGIFVALGKATPKQEFDALANEQSVPRPVKRIDTVDKDAATMPQGVRFVYYAGRDARSGHELVWQSIPKNGPDDGDRLEAECVAAYALAALDAGVVGEPWKALFARRTGDASRQELGRSIGRALQEASDAKQKRSTADATWLRKNVVVGMARADAYSALRSYGLVAFNGEFSPGVSIGTGKWTGCAPRLQDAGLWPYHGEPIPKATGGCAAFARTKPDPFPSAYIRLEGAFSLSCSTETMVTLDFDDADRVKRVDIAKPEAGCV